MNIKRLAGIAILILIFIMGCSGNIGRLKTQPDSVSKVTQRELIDNSSDYDIRYNRNVVVFDLNNDDKTILVENYWSRVNDHETWAQIVNGGTSGKHDDAISQVWAFYPNSGIREIRSLNDQFYGYVLYRQRELVSAKVVDEYTMRLIHNYGVYPMGP
jgi:hypothetical protein